MTRYEDQGGNIMIADEANLVTTYQPLVKKIAKSIAFSTSMCQYIEDLIGYGNAGLLLGLRMFDPERGCKQMNYVFLRVHGAVMDGCRQLVDMRKLTPVSATNATNFMPEQNAWVFPASPQRLQEALDQPSCALDDFGASICASHWTYERFSSPSQRLETRLTRKRLEELINELPQPESIIITESYLNNKPIPLIAKQLHCTKGWICRVRKRAIELLRQRIEESGDLF